MGLIKIDALIKNKIRKTIKTEKSIRVSLVEKLNCQGNRFPYFHIKFDKTFANDFGIQKGDRLGFYYDEDNFHSWVLKKKDEGGYKLTTYGKGLYLLVPCIMFNPKKDYPKELKTLFEIDGDTIKINTSFKREKNK